MPRPNGTTKEEMSSRSFKETAKLYADGIKDHAESSLALLNLHMETFDRPPEGIKYVKQFIEKILHDAEVIIKL